MDRALLCPQARFERAAGVFLWEAADARRVFQCTRAVLAGGLPFSDTYRRDLNEAVCGRRVPQQPTPDVEHAPLPGAGEAR
jgi:hypothetical protein